MLNFVVDPQLLEPLRPKGTLIDDWNGQVYISLVGFLFQSTKLRGIPIPFHRNFEEINLRFYVRSHRNGELRRGVVFVNEVVPRFAIALVARRIYNENYLACRMRSSRHTQEKSGDSTVAYGWKHQGHWLSIGATYTGEALVPAEDSEETFITEHYWGYAAQKNGGTVEYQVEHPRWPVWRAKEVLMDGDFGSFYGPPFGKALSQKPSSAFIAEGSPVIVRSGETMV